MVDVSTDQNFPSVVLEIMDSHVPPRPALVEGIPVWASSDETVLTVTPTADGMGAMIDTVAVGTARITVTADADLGAGVVPLTGVTEDIVVSLGTLGMASTMTLTLGEPVAKA